MANPPNTTLGKGTNPLTKGAKPFVANMQSGESIYLSIYLSMIEQYTNLKHHIKYPENEISLNKTNKTKGEGWSTAN